MCITAALRAVALSDSATRAEREIIGMIADLRRYTVSKAARQPLVDFIHAALETSGCRIIYSSPPGLAPFVVTFELATGERMGIVVYAFLATRTLTTNRPEDERSFQVKYGRKESYADLNNHI